MNITLEYNDAFNRNDFNDIHFTVSTLLISIFSILYSGFVFVNMIILIYIAQLKSYLIIKNTNLVNSTFVKVIY